MKVSAFFPKVFLVLVVSVLSMHLSYSQSPGIITGRNNKGERVIHLIPELGLNAQKNLFGEAGIILGREATEGGGVIGLGGIKLASEFSSHNSHLIIAPKVSLEFDAYYLSTRINVVDYIYLNTRDIRVGPEVGFGYAGFATLCVALNIPVTSDRNPVASWLLLTTNVNFIRYR